MSVSFFKIHGCGNDFIAFDNREFRLPVTDMAHWARFLCKNHVGIGADGLFFLENTPPGREGDYIWHYFNPDGTRTGMCGNGARCAAYLAVVLGIAPPSHTIGTDAGLVDAQVDAQNRQVCITLTKPQNLNLNMDLPLQSAGYKVNLRAHTVDTGDPHLVVFMENAHALAPSLGSLDVSHWGQYLSRHEVLHTGQNVNFVEIADKRTLKIRVFETGVEAETQACGTGGAAALCISHALGLTESSISVHMPGGKLDLELASDRPILTGPVELVYGGALSESTVQRLYQTLA